MTKTAIKIIVICFVLAGFFHMFVTPDAVYMPNGETHVCWIWKPSNQIFVVFPL